MHPFYSLCRQTVTVYRREAGNIVRRVYPRAYFEQRRQKRLDFRENQTHSRVGDRAAGSFLAVIPGPEQAVFPGDRLYLGVGPQLAPEDWVDFLPTRVPGLAVAVWAEPKFWNGRILHTEAGG